MNFLIKALGGTTPSEVSYIRSREFNRGRISNENEVLKERSEKESWKIRADKAEKERREQTAADLALACIRTLNAISSGKEQTEIDALYSQMLMAQNSYNSWQTHSQQLKQHGVGYQGVGSLFNGLGISFR